jgi:molybdate transport system regulatory protein
MEGFVEKKHNKLDVSGKIWMHKSSGELLGNDRILLLEKIREYGSISKAAKVAGVSYKTAWEIVNAMNNLSEKPLVVRASGGKGGGGTQLTREAAEIIRQFRTIQEEHERFLVNVADRMDDGAEFVKFVNRISMKLSARNMFKGTISKVKPGAVNTEIVLQLKGKDSIVAIITNESVENLNIKMGKSAYAIVKASSVIIGKDLDVSKLSARNKLIGKIIKIVKGAVNTEMTLQLPGDNTISAIMTNESVLDMDFIEGEQVYAIFKASSVIIGVE